MTDREIYEQIITRLGMTSNVYKGANNLMCSCPYHSDKHPSCGVNLTNGLYHCFSCNRGGTLRSLYKDICGHSINKDLNIKWTPTGEVLVNNPFKIKEYVEEDFSKQPETDFAFSGRQSDISTIPEVVEYLNKRKITLAVAKKMRMSFSIDMKSYSKLDPSNLKLQVNFSNRLLIPIYENGVLMSCEGRDIFGEDAFYKTAKEKGLDLNKVHYKKCVYPTGASTSTLYGIDSLDKNEMIYFCEGIMDLAILREDSFFNKKNSTAIFGAALSKRQLFLLKEYSFTDILDNDLAGWLLLKKLYDELIKVPERDRKDWRFVIPPYHDLGVKDIGDLPVKANVSVEDIRNRKWLDSSRSILDNKELIYNTVERLEKEKLEKKNKENEIQRVPIRTRTPIN